MSLVGPPALILGRRLDGTSGESSVVRRLLVQRPAITAIVGGTSVAGGLTLHRYGLSGNGLAWLAVQLILGFIAAFDVATRRVLNVVVLPGTVAVVGLRAIFVSTALTQTVLGAIIAFAVFFVAAIALRGGLGMGDVKLAGFLGALFGSSATGALVVGCVAGGVAAALLLLSGHGRKATFAYGPYLALGAAVWILVADPPRLY